jgi:hypothetical protein
MAARTNRGHPRRTARRERAAERLAAHVHGPTCKRNRLALMRAQSEEAEGAWQPPVGADTSSERMSTESASAASAVAISPRGTPSDRSLRSGRSRSRRGEGSER